MKRILALLTSMLVTSAIAADNGLVVTNGAGVTLRSRDTTGAGGPQAPSAILVDPAGNFIGGNFTNYGTAPAAVLSPYTNAFVTNANVNGRASSANSAPVVPNAAPLTSVTVNTTGASASATSVKGTPATLFSCQAGNVNATPVYVHIFNKATAPTPGTDSAVKTLIVPGNTAGAGSNSIFGPGGIVLNAGFGLTITAGIATIDNTTVTTANTVVVSCDYE